ncbi:MAG: sigma factor-like helix-turn-helix DNA-binding protein [Elusimicrobiota bacterium]|jgi:transposase
MHRTRELLRLKYACGLSNREVARACGVNRETVAVYLQRAHTAGLGWPLPEGLTDAELDERLFPVPAGPLGPERPMPDCQYIYDELRAHKKLNLTIMQLWIEYKELHPDGYQYTQFCRYYHAWRSKLDRVMR